MKTITRLKTICQHVAPLELEDRRAELFYKHRAPTGASGHAASCFLHPFYQFACRVSGQKPADDFLHEEGQIGLGERYIGCGEAVLFNVGCEVVFVDGGSIRHITKQGTKASLLKMDVVSQGVN